MDVISVEAVPYDRRLYYRNINDIRKSDIFSIEAASPTIFASSLSKIGWLYYDPYILCDGKCYTGLDLNTTGKVLVFGYCFRIESLKEFKYIVILFQWVNNGYQE